VIRQQNITEYAVQETAHKKKGRRCRLLQRIRAATPTL